VTAIGGVTGNARCGNRIMRVDMGLKSELCDRRPEKKSWPLAAP
jgi:hypothetical protein